MIELEFTISSFNLLMAWKTLVSILVSYVFCVLQEHFTLRVIIGKVYNLECVFCLEVIFTEGQQSQVNILTHLNEVWKFSVNSEAKAKEDAEKPTNSRKQMICNFFISLF